MLPPERTHDFFLDQVNEVTFRCSGELTGMYKLSPFVWQEAAGYELLLRVVNYSDNPAEKVARIHYGSSRDGLEFILGDKPVIPPGPDQPDSLDSGGCEDPTVAHVDGMYHVYYSGWNERLKRGELLRASGPSITQLEKCGIALPSSDLARNPKEATIVPVVDGTWRLFFEYAHDQRSKIGIAASPAVTGPWTVLPPPFESRAGHFDRYHLSTGPIVGSDSPFPVMFYNGATQGAEWRIGWIVLDAEYSRVLARCEDPIVIPGKRRYDEDTDIAFAASAIHVDGSIHLYYSIADRHVMRATIRRA